MTTVPENRALAGRDSNGHFAKGVSGNPGGRPTGLASAIRERTHDGEDLVDFYLAVWKGEKVFGRIYTKDQSLEAARWLADRSWGKAVQQSLVGLNDARNPVRDQLQAMTLEGVLALMARMESEMQALPEGDVIDVEVVEGGGRDLA